MQCLKKIIINAKKIHHEQNIKILNKDKIQPYAFTTLLHLSCPNRSPDSNETLFTKTGGCTGCSLLIKKKKNQVLIFIANYLHSPLYFAVPHSSYPDATCAKFPQIWEAHICPPTGKWTTSRKDLEYVLSSATSCLSDLGPVTCLPSLTVATCRIRESPTA